MIGPQKWEIILCIFGTVEDPNSKILKAGLGPFTWLIFSNLLILGYRRDYSLAIFSKSELKKNMDYDMTLIVVF